MRVFVYISSRKFVKRHATIVTTRNAGFVCISIQKFAKRLVTIVTTRNAGFCLHFESKIRKTSCDNCHNKKCGFCLHFKSKIRKTSVTIATTRISVLLFTFVQKQIFRHEMQIRRYHVNHNAKTYLLPFSM